MSFHKQVLADIGARRLSTGDFISLAAQGAGHALEPVVSMEPAAALPMPVSGPVQDYRKTLSVVGRSLDGACDAAARGHVFDLGAFDTLQGLVAPAVDAFIAGRLVVPYDDTLFVLRADMSSLFPTGSEEAWGTVPFGVHVSADASGGPKAFSTFVLAERDGGVAFLPFGSLVSHGDPENPSRVRVLPTTFNADGSMDRAETEQRGAITFHFGVAALLLVNDDRLAFRRDVPAPALNKARMKSGKPPLPGVWRMPPPAVVSAYITRLGIKVQGPQTSKGGTHASPVLHERRGHLRRLASGRITKVRSALVGGLDKHLDPTRTRAFYEVKQ